MKEVFRKKRFIRHAPKTLIGILIIIPTFVFLGFVPDFSTLLGLIIIEIACVIILFKNNIKVMPQGIKCNRIFFRWEEIKTIGIAVTKKGKPHKFYFKTIYISRESYNRPVHISYRRDCQKEASDNVEIVFYHLENYNLTQRLITASYNRRLLYFIISYWGDDIKNFNDVKEKDLFAKSRNIFNNK